MKIIGCDLHAAQQTIAMLDRETGEVVEQTLTHDGRHRAGILRGDSATGGGRARSDRLHGMVSAAAGRARDPVPRGTSGDVRKAETRQQKHDRRDAAMLLQLLAENRFPAIWIPSTELRDLRALCCTGISGCACARGCSNALHAIVLGQACSAAIRCGIETARRCWPRCRCPRTRRIAAMSFRRCISSWIRRSISSTPREAGGRAAAARDASS